MTTNTTECPNCHTVFRVGEIQLQKAGGSVRCSQCNEIFNARAFLSTAPSINTGIEKESNSGNGHSTEPILTTNSFAQALEEIQHETTNGESYHNDDDFASNEQSKKNSPGEDHHIFDEILKNNDIPSALTNDLIAEQIPKKKSHPVLWGFCTLILISTLFIQYAYFSRENLAQDPRFRPWLITMCNLLHCNIPHKKNLAELHLLSRDVLIAPSNNEDALIIQLSFVNKAPYIQPFPVLQIYLSDANGKTTNMRRIKPEEYLSPAVDITQGLEQNVPISLTLELVKPEEDPFAFQIDFL